MHPKRYITVATLLLTVLMGRAGVADDKAAAKPKVNYNDNVAPIFQSRCNSCHNADKAKGGLALETYAATMQGGGSGKVIEPGDLGGSHLWELITHAAEPKMPPSAPKIPDAELNTIKAWIEAGAPETSGSVVAAKAKPKFEMKLDPSSMGKPVGPPAMPEGVSTEPVVVSPRANAIVAMASSPWAPLVAVAGHKQILLYETKKNHLVGVFPFPEGSIHVMKFSRNGSLLLVGGGRGGQKGLAVVYDVKNGKRIFEIGKEYDVVLAADISPDHGQVALGGPSKIVRVYSTADGQLQYEMKKHTEWITAIEFSPDGVLLASGDRNNGLIVWEANTGREFFELRGHTLSITDVTWRLDSNVLASASEDGSIRLWEMENGNQIKAWTAHPGGITSARFAKDGRIVTTGRDRGISTWDQNGGKKKDYERFNDLALRAVFAEDDTKVVAGDWTGEIRVFEANQGTRLTNLLANPAPVATRLELAKSQAVTAKAAADKALQDLAPFEAAIVEKTKSVTVAQQALTASQQAEAKKAGEIAALEKDEAEKTRAMNSALEALKVVQANASRAEGERAAAEKAVTDTKAREKALADALPGSRQAVDKALSDKLAHDKSLSAAVDAVKAATTKAAIDQANNALQQALARSNELNAALAALSKKQAEAVHSWNDAVAARDAAPALLATATEKARAAADAVKPVQGAADQALALKNAASKTLADARPALKTAKDQAVALKAQFDGANAAKAAAEKALADRKPAADALKTKAEDLRLEVEALAKELKTDAPRTAQQ